MQAILERRTGRTDIRLHEPEWSSLWRANVRLVNRYREGRVFLAGDAGAHSLARRNPHAPHRQMARVLR
jgi:2-polyprenyl-6-methoxyphenol hydroxylase-like FAD-dependent oxidoreductase